MDDQAFYIGYVGQQGEQLQMINELMGFLLAPFDFKGKNAGAAVGEIFFI